MIPLQNFSVSLKFGACYIMHKWGWFRLKNAVLAFLGGCLFLFFFIIKLPFFIIFISFFDEVSNLRGRISTNKKQELVVQNCQRNSIHDDLAWQYSYLSMKRHSVECGKIQTRKSPNTDRFHSVICKVKSLFVMRHWLVFYKQKGLAIFVTIFTN